MKWTALPIGCFTNIDWAEPGASAGFDPYLIWAEADRFAGYGDQQPQWLPIAIELTGGISVAQLIAAASAKWLRVPPVYTSSALPSGLRFCTARVKPDFFKQIQAGGPLHALVKRLELGLPAGVHVDELTQATTQTPTAPETLLKGKVIGLIDDSVAFASANFLRAGKARTKYFWRQDGKGVGHTPEDFGYGHEISAGAIDQAMTLHTYNGLVDESQVYREFGLFRLEHLASHGTHVLDLAAGPRSLDAQVTQPNAPPSWALADDDASRAPIVAVQLDWDTIEDTSGGSMNVQVLDGLLYILSRCEPDAKVAVNVSWGTLAGPHDGSSLLEAAMDQLIELKNGYLQIVLPAGNSYQSRTHANATLLKDEHITLDWRGEPDDLTQNFVEIWIDQGREGLEIEVTPPGYPALAPLKWGESGLWMNSEGKPLLALIYPQRVATGERGSCALLATAPTFSFQENTATAPSGVWKLRITNRQEGAATFDAYVERDDDLLGVGTGARQSYFEDKYYDASGNPDSFVDHPDNPTLIRRSGNFNSIATGGKTVTVGGTRLSDGSWAHYSPRKPDPDLQRPQRQGVVKVPDVHAASDENAELGGVRAAGTRSNAVARFRGTSDAAPQITRQVLNAL